jgi:hypothetical protein
MLSRSIKMPLNLTDQHAQSDGGKSETPSAGDDEPLWRADFLRCEASSHNPTGLRAPDLVLPVSRSVVVKR